MADRTHWEVRRADSKSQQPRFLVRTRDGDTWDREALGHERRPIGDRADALLQLFEAGLSEATAGAMLDMAAEHPGDRVVCGLDGTIRRVGRDEIEG